jgi:hypothetical protein
MENQPPIATNYFLDGCLSRAEEGLFWWHDPAPDMDFDVPVLWVLGSAQQLDRAIGHLRAAEQDITVLQKKRSKLQRYIDAIFSDSRSIVTEVLSMLLPGRIGQLGETLDQAIGLRTALDSTREQGIERDRFDWDIEDEYNDPVFDLLLFWNDLANVRDFFAAGHPDHPGFDVFSAAMKTFEERLWTHRSAIRDFEYLSRLSESEFRPDWWWLDRSRYLD